MRSGNLIPGWVVFRQSVDSVVLDGIIIVRHGWHVVTRASRLGLNTGHHGLISRLLDWIPKKGSFSCRTCIREFENRFTVLQIKKGMNRLNKSLKRESKATYFVPHDFGRGSELAYKSDHYFDVKQK